MRIKVTNEGTLIDLLMKEFVSSSRSNIKKLIANGTVTVNRKRIVNPAFRVNINDDVEYRKFRQFEAIESPFPVLYEDEHLIVVVKPAGILTYGERGTEGTSVYRELLNNLKEKTKGRGHVYVVHRLDREVSGILVFARTEKIQQLIKDHWKENNKRYYALVEGRPPDEEGTVRSFLKENKELKVYTTDETPDSKFAVTHYKVIRKLEGRSLLEISIETGRKHQIRVHLADIGCPVVGDTKYGSGDKKMQRIQLHAYYFAMKHPVTGEMMEFKTELPEGFVR